MADTIVIYYSNTFTCFRLSCLSVCGLSLQLGLNAVRTVKGCCDRMALRLLELNRCTSYEWVAVCDYLFWSDKVLSIYFGTDSYVFSGYSHSCVHEFIVYGFVPSFQTFAPHTAHIPYVDSFGFQYRSFLISSLPVNGIVVRPFGNVNFIDGPVPWPETTECDNNDAHIHNVMLPFDCDDVRWWRFRISFMTHSAFISLVLELPKTVCIIFIWKLIICGEDGLLNASRCTESCKRTEEKPWRVSIHNRWTNDKALNSIQFNYLLSISARHIFSFETANRMCDMPNTTHIFWLIFRGCPSTTTRERRVGKRKFSYPHFSFFVLYKKNPCTKTFHLKRSTLVCSSYSLVQEFLISNRSNPRGN